MNDIFFISRSEAEYFLDNINTQKTKISSE